MSAVSYYTQNPWHNVTYGKNAPSVVNAVIEIKKGSKGKYELDKQSGLLKLDRVLYGAVHYPSNYGFIPQTYCDDHDPLDILVLCGVEIEPLSLVEAKVVGVMTMVDQGEQDDKIIAVAAKDPSVNEINDISDMPKHLLNEVTQFFEDYKKLEGKSVHVEKKYGDKEAAKKVIIDAIHLYDKTFRNKIEIHVPGSPMTIVYSQPRENIPGESKL